MGIECGHGRILTSKNSAKLKQYYYFHAKFLEEVQQHHCSQERTLYMSLHQPPGRFILCSRAPPTATSLRLILPTTTTTTTTIRRNSHLCSTGNGGSPSSNYIKWFQSTISILYNLTLLNSCCWVWQLSLVLFLFHSWKNIMVYLDQLL